ncbi:15472_t:CDS:1, partial [Cetraspora pellucida]
YNNFTSFTLSPEPFIKLKNVSNEFEVASWVANHPRVLNLAITIHEAKEFEILDNHKICPKTYRYSFMSNHLEINK